MDTLTDASDGGKSTGPTVPFVGLRSDHAEWVARWKAQELEHEQRRKTHLHTGGWGNILVCVTCLDQFGASHSRALYCSRKCCYEARKRRRPPRVAWCKVCDALFKPKGSRAKFCSNKCRQTAYRARRTSGITKSLQRNADVSTAHEAQLPHRNGDACPIVIQTVQRNAVQAGGAA